MDFITIAAISIIIQVGDPETNLDRIEYWSKQASQAQADMALFSENSVPGYWQRPDIRYFGESLDGPSVKRLTAIAKEANIIICAGILENEGAHCYSTTVFVGPEGVIDRRRCSAMPDGQFRFLDVGDDNRLINIRNIPMGVSTSYETVSPGTCKILGDLGVKIILAPFANGVSRQDILAGKREYFKQRAIDNKAWLVTCDQSHYEDDQKTRTRPGAACFVDPAGQIVALTPESATGEHMVTYKIGIPKN